MHKTKKPQNVFRDKNENWIDFNYYLLLWCKNKVLSGQAAEVKKLSSLPRLWSHNLIKLTFQDSRPYFKSYFFIKASKYKKYLPKNFFCRHFLGLDVLVKFLSTVVIGKVGQDHKTWTWLEKLYDLNISAQYQGNNKAETSALCWKSYRNAWKR